MTICTNCNGKGYNTVYKGEGGYTDFGPMKYIETLPMGIHKVPCSRCQVKEEVKDIEKEITGQTVYEQLQEILNKCMDLGWKPRGEGKWGYEKLSCDEDGMYISYGVCISYHDLFSKDSGIMEFVEWERTDLARDLDSMLDRSDGYEYWSSKCHTIKELHEMIMAKMTAEEKCSYFVKNARVPTK